jgi:hypothetical protein
MAREDTEMKARIVDVVASLDAIETLDRATLAAFITEDPNTVPILATCVGLTQEQLKNQLSHRFKTSSWSKLARQNARELIRVLDEEFGLVERLAIQRRQQWTFSDILLERYLWSRRGAASAVGQGRRVEDEIQTLVDSLGIASRPRTRFAGRGGETAPCDLAMPSGGELAQIVIAMKGFNSTGSKLSDAVREVEQMANVRLPNQYVFVVIDGLGWKSRQADLRRIHELWNKRSIDGLYALKHLDRLESDLRDAADRLNLLPRSE